jgi:hypothetical protein
MSSPFVCSSAKFRSEDCLPETAADVKDDTEDRIARRNSGARVPACSRIFGISAPPCGVGFWIH